MSTYSRMTKNPKTGKFENATWHDDYFAHHHYGVEFPDGSVVDPWKVELETRERNPSEVEHDKQRIRGIEKQQMDDGFRGSMKVVREVVQQSLPKHDKDMTSEWEKELFDIVQEIHKKKRAIAPTMIIFIRKLLSQQREQILEKAVEFADGHVLNKPVGSPVPLFLHKNVYKQILSEYLLNLPSLQPKKEQDV